MAAMDYRESGAEPEFSGSERFIWPAIRRDIDESVAAQKAISASRSEAGKQGGRPESEKANAFYESNEKQKKQMLSEESKKSYGQRKRTKEKDKIYTEGAANGGLSPSACPRLLKRLLRLRRRIKEELMKASILVKFWMERGGDNVFLTDGYGHAVEDD